MGERFPANTRVDVRVPVRPYDVVENFRRVPGNLRGGDTTTKVQARDPAGDADESAFITSSRNAAFRLGIRKM